MASFITAGNATNGLQVSSDNTGILELRTGTGSGTTAVTFSTGQRATFPSTISVGNTTPATTGAGITFPAAQSASSDANTLDDYEEGTWTPVLTALTGTITSYTSSGTYTKVGRMVILNVTYTVTNNGTGAGYGIISGFPFTANAQGGCAVTRIGGTTGNASVLEFGGTSGQVYTYANAYPWATNANGSFSILYQV